MVHAHAHRSGGAVVALGNVVGQNLHAAVVAQVEQHSFLAVMVHGLHLLPVHAEDGLEALQGGKERDVGSGGKIAVGQPMVAVALRLAGSEGAEHRGVQVPIGVDLHLGLGAADAHREFPDHRIGADAQGGQSGGEEAEGQAQKAELCEPLAKRFPEHGVGGYNGIQMGWIRIHGVGGKGNMLQKNRKAAFAFFAVWF